MKHLALLLLWFVACSPAHPKQPYVSQEQRATENRREQPTAPPEDAEVTPPTTTTVAQNTAEQSPGLSRLVLEPSGRLALMTYERVPLRVSLVTADGGKTDVTSQATFEVRNPNALTVRDGLLETLAQGSQATTVVARLGDLASAPTLVSTFSPFLYLGFEEALTVSATGATVVRSTEAPLNGSASLLVRFNGSAGSKFRVQAKLQNALSMVNAERLTFMYQTDRGLQARCGTLNGSALLPAFEPVVLTLGQRGLANLPMRAAEFDHATDARFFACEVTLLESGAGELRIDEVRAFRQFIAGANLAWLDGAYEHDFGRSFHHPSWPVAYNPAHVDSILTLAQQMGIRLLRVWVFEGCEGLEKDGDEYVTGVGPELWQNFDDFVFNRLPRYDIKVYFMMVGAAHTHDCSSPSPFDDPRARTALYDNAVLPFVSRYASSPWVWGVDLMNEPEGGIAGFTGNYLFGTSWANARSFLADGAREISAIAPHLLVSSGSGWHQQDNVAAGRFSGLGFSHLDWHAYNDEGTLPTYESLQRHAKVMIGEAGQFSGSVDPALQSRVVARMLSEAARKSYWGVLPWAIDYPGAHGNLSMLDPSSRYPNPLPADSLLQLQSFISSRGDIGP